MPTGSISKSSNEERRKAKGKTANSAVDLQPEGGAGVFVRVCAAVTCVLLAASLMNVSVFPLFDPLFTYARDISVVANAATLIALGLVGTLRPLWLRVALSVRIVVMGTILGSVLLVWSLAWGNAWALTIAACVVAVARGWAMVAVGVAAASCLTSRQIAPCIALAFVAYYLLTVFSWVVPSGIGLVGFLALPMVALALVWREALPVLQEIERGEAPIDTAVTQPSSFLSLGSQLFVCLFLFRVAFGFSLRFGEMEGVPLSDFLVIVPVAIVAVFVLVRRDGAFSADLLTQISVLCVVGGFFIYAALGLEARMAATTLLSAGNTLFDIVAWVVLIAAAARNRRASVAIFAWGRGVSGLGTTLGAAIGVWMGQAFGVDTHLVAAAQGALILVFVGYALIGLHRFSFAETIQGVVPAVDAATATPELQFEDRCREVAQRYGLTARELEVFMMLARGRDRTYIQEQLTVSRNTVKAHVKHIYAKLGIHAHQDLIDLVEQNDGAQRINEEQPVAPIVRP